MLVVVVVVVVAWIETATSFLLVWQLQGRRGSTCDSEHASMAQPEPAAVKEKLILSVYFLSPVRRCIESTPPVE